MSQPRVLIVVPAHGGRPAALRRAVASARDQQDEPTDVVVVASPAHADALQVVDEYGATAVDDPGRGLGAAVNAGLATATPLHEYCGWLGEDDVLLPGAIRTAAACLDADPDAVLAFGDCQYLTGDGEYLFTPHARRWAQRLLALGFDQPAQPATVFRLAALTALGGLDESLTHSMDLDLLLRLSRCGRFVATGRTLAAFRWQSRTATTAQRMAVAAEARRVRARYLTGSPTPLSAAYGASAQLLAHVTAHSHRVAPRAQRSARWLSATGPGR